MSECKLLYNRIYEWWVHIEHKQPKRNKTDSLSVNHHNSSFSMHFTTFFYHSRIGAYNTSFIENFEWVQLFSVYDKKNQSKINNLSQIWVIECWKLVLGSFGCFFSISIHHSCILLYRSLHSDTSRKRLFSTVFGWFWTKSPKIWTVWLVYV